jgi:hypothetical protein
MAKPENGDPEADPGEARTLGRSRRSPVSDSQSVIQQSRVPAPGARAAAEGVRSCIEKGVPSEKVGRRHTLRFEAGPIGSDNLCRIENPRVHTCDE